MAYYWLGSDYLSDSHGENLRRFLFDLTQGMSVEDSLDKNSINGTIDFIHENKPMFEFPCEDCHVAYMFKREGKILCYIKVFDVFEGLICISQNSDLYPDFTSKCMFFEYKTKNYSEHFNVILD